MSETRELQGLTVRDLSKYRDNVAQGHGGEMILGPWQYRLVLQGEGPESFTDELDGHKVHFQLVEWSPRESVYVGWRLSS